MDIGDELHRARVAAGLTQGRLAELVGTSQATVSAYERGRKLPSITTFERLLTACGARLEIERARRSPVEFAVAGRHLAEVLALAEALPYRPSRELRYPRLAAAA